MALPYIQFYPTDYLTDTAHLTLEEHGAYLLLILNYWQRGGPLPADNKKLAGICRATVEQWLNIRSTLLDFFEESDGRWTHHRIEIELSVVRAKSEKASKAGKISAAKRAESKGKSNIRSTSKRTFNHTDTDTDTDKTTKPPLPPLEIDGLNTQAWEQFVAYRRENRIKKLQPSSVKTQQRWLVKQGSEQVQQQIVEQTIRQGWQGLQPLKTAGNTTQSAQSAPSRFMENLKNA